MNDTGTEDIHKPTVNDIARVAGVSLATVDRVLNARPGVRSVTIEKVNTAIAELGYVRDTAAANLARRRVYRLLFVLPDTENEFVVALNREIEKQIAPMALDRTTARKVLVPPFDPQAIVITTGADALAGDPLSKLTLSNSALFPERSWTPYPMLGSFCRSIPNWILMISSREI